MNKDELEAVYKELNRLRGEYQVSYSRYQSGRNKKVRSDAQRECENIIHSTMYNLKKQQEIFDIAAGGSNDPMMRAEYINELQKLNWFARDMADILEKIKEKIITTE